MTASVLMIKNKGVTMTLTKIHDANEEQLSFLKNTEAIVKWIRGHWDFKEFVPKNFRKYLKDYNNRSREIYNDLSNIDEKELLEKFKGLDDTTEISNPFPVKIDVTQVALDQMKYGKRPLDTLVGAILSYGFRMGMRYNNIIKERNIKINNRGEKCLEK